MFHPSNATAKFSGSILRQKRKSRNPRMCAVLKSISNHLSLQSSSQSPILGRPKVLCSQRSGDEDQDPCWSLGEWWWLYKQLTRTRMLKFSCKTCFKISSEMYNKPHMNFQLTSCIFSWQILLMSCMHFPKPWPEECKEILHQAQARGNWGRTRRWAWSRGWRG